MAKYNRRICNRRRKRKNPKPNYILTATSLIFITNVMIGAYTQQYIYAGLFALLTVTSVAVHSGDPLVVNILDKLVIFAVFLWGLNAFYHKWISPKSNNIVSFATLSTCFFVIWVYCYGYICNKYCFDPDPVRSNIWHASMHFVGSFGFYLMLLYIKYK